MNCAVADGRRGSSGKGVWYGIEVSGRVEVKEGRFCFDGCYRQPSKWSITCALMGERRERA